MPGNVGKSFILVIHIDRQSSFDLTGNTCRIRLSNKTGLTCSSLPENSFWAIKTSIDFAIDSQLRLLKLRDLRRAREKEFFSAPLSPSD